MLSDGVWADMLVEQLVVTQVLVGSFGLAEYTSYTSAVRNCKFWHDVNGQSRGRIDALASDFMQDAQVSAPTEHLMEHVRLCAFPSPRVS
jgi:hypothetical protein